MTSRVEKWAKAKRFAKRHGLHSSEAYTILNRHGFDVAAARREVRCAAALARACRILAKVYRVSVKADIVVNKK